MDREKAIEAVALLRVAQDALTKYREFTGGERPSMSDLSVQDSLDGLAGDGVITSADEVMVEFLVQNQVIEIDEEGYLWQSMDEELTQWLEDAGLYVA